ncbi:polymer-forming cytoskeletal protein [Corticibacter populi]|uniref:Polymer-forming cytoskeletal protein n=1 Tax=Corticibacter populi TaxID=1550736 RepID=A0A3M6QXB8_9BURK|nr:polymer-forming cytoskeletal protein [Corticibacter populi]RZS30152.1 cytoskeletal protein CcmA (bactofilin family) [Corticibacter populi]
MFTKRKQPPLRSLVAEGCQVQGDIVFSDGIRIDGAVQGLVSGEASASKKGTLVFISEHGRVSGGIRADVVVINGRVDGPIHATQLLELQPKARITGDVSYRQLEMHPGALLSGRMLPMVTPAGEDGKAERALLPGQEPLPQLVEPRGAGAANGQVLRALPAQGEAGEPSGLGGADEAVDAGKAQKPAG